VKDGFSNHRAAIRGFRDSHELVSDRHDSKELHSLLLSGLTMCRMMGVPADARYPNLAIKFCILWVTKPFPDAE
jgi:hypothetical protein